MQEGWRILSCGISNTADYCKEFIAQMKKKSWEWQLQLKKNQNPSDKHGKCRGVEWRPWAKCVNTTKLGAIVNCPWQTT